MGGIRPMRPPLRPFLRSIARLGTASGVRQCAPYNLFHGTIVQIYTGTEAFAAPRHMQALCQPAVSSGGAIVLVLAPAASA